jgi:glycosyltransferase involved in cell wall biosynthesis
MAGVSETMESARPPMVSAALCVDGEALDRFGRVLRHLCVGLVDQAISVRLLSSDARVGSLALGPIQSLVHPRITWPAAGRRIERLLDALSGHPPTVVHAMSQGSYRLASAIAEGFDADLVLGVTSLADCDRIAQLGMGKHVRFHVFSEPLATILEAHLKFAREQIEVIRPGTPVSQRAACFAEPGRVATLLCTSAFERDSGVDRLIAAVNLLGQRGHILQVFLLAGGRQESTLRRLVRMRNLSSSVTFAPPLSDLAAAMQSADIFVRPSADTGFTADGLLAMGAGLVVVTDPSTLCDHVRAGETAMVCAHPTAESLAATIDGVLHHREKATAVASAAMEYVREHHAMSTMADRTAAAYRRLALTLTTFAIRES